ALLHLDRQAAAGARTVTLVSPAPSSADAVALGRDRRTRRRRVVIALLAAILVAAFVLTLMLGQSFTPPAEVLAVLMGETVPGASFTVGTLRLPRAVLSVIAGLSFGMGGVAFQTML